MCDEIGPITDVPKKLNYVTLNGIIILHYYVKINVTLNTINNLILKK